MIMLVADDLDRLTLRRVTAYHRIVARLRAASLDAELAAGISPETCDYLAARAFQLTSMKSRRQLAAGLERVLATAGGLGQSNTAAGGLGQSDTDASGSTRPAVPVVPLRMPLRRARVTAAAAELGELARHLLTPGPVPARGVAIVRQLLSDGAGPLYRESCQVDLRDVARQAALTLVYYPS